jgi:hypothetical protein
MIGQTLQSPEQKCTSDVCIMDNITLNYVDSQQSGDVQFNNICGGCQGESQCECWFSNIDINSIDSIIQKGIDFSNNCSACYTVPEGGSPTNATQVNCTTFQPIGPSPPPPPSPTPSGGFLNWIESHKTIITVIGIGIIVLIVIVMIIIAIRHRKK